MTHEFTYAQPQDDAEFTAMLDIVSDALNFPRDAADRYAQLVGTENFRVVRCGSSPAGGLALLPMGQFFGGRSVPTVGIAAVGIAPEWRSRGAATAMLKAMLREQHASGWALSSLYPATLPLYRRVGYEQAGSRFEIRLHLRSIELRDGSLSVRRITPDDTPEIETLYRTRARQAPGCIDRTPFFWQRVRAHRGETTQGYMAFDPETGRAEGYLYYLRKGGQDPAFQLHLTDFVAATPRAARRLLSLLIDHQSVADTASWFGGPNDAILKLVPERWFKVQLLDYWMLRIVDVGAALSARGYPIGLRAELHLDVEDDLLMPNNGRYVLEINNGTSRVMTGGRGDARIDIRGLAALYTGFATAHDLLMTGQLQFAPNVSSPADLLATVDAIFAGPTPWMPDAF